MTNNNNNNYNNNNNNNYDVVIIGARCAGAATAMLLARRGLRVLVLDRGRYGTDTLSTHALMRPAVSQLASWGLLDKLVEADTPAIRETTFYYGDSVIALPIKSRDGVSELYAPRRTLLDSVLVDAARQAGAEFRYCATLKSLLRSTDQRVVGARYRDEDGQMLSVNAGTVVGADGIRSLTAKLAGARTYHQGPLGSATIYGHFEGIDQENYHWYYQREVAAGSLKTSGSANCIFTAVSVERFAREIASDVPGGFERLLFEANPELAERTSRGRRIGKLFGFGGASGHLRTPCGPGWALVGDAGYFRDPLTAHGITDALRDAELLSQAIVDGRPGAMMEYHVTRDAIAKPFMAITDKIASFQNTLPELQALHLEINRQMQQELHTAGLARSETSKAA